MDDPLEDLKLSPEAKKKLKDHEQLKKELAEGKSAQEILGISNETMGRFYQAAYHLFEQKRYEEASHAFLFLATLNPHQQAYWLGLGMATQMCHDYEAAIDAYELAAIADISSPVPYFYLAKCLFAIHDRVSALQALNLAIETAGEADEYADLRQQAQMAREILLKHSC